VSPTVLSRAVQIALRATVRNSSQVRQAAFGVLVAVARVILARGTIEVEAVAPLLPRMIEAASLAVVSTDVCDEVKERATSMLFNLCLLREKGLIEASQIETFANNHDFALTVAAATNLHHIIKLRERSLKLLAAIIGVTNEHLTLGASICRARVDIRRQS